MKSEGGFTGSLLGNAQSATSANSATTAVNASNAFNVYVGNDDTGDNTNAILFSNTGGAGYRAVYEDSSLTYDNTNNVLYSPTVDSTIIKANDQEVLHVSAMVDPFGKTFPIGPSFEGAKYTYWTQNHFNNGVPVGWGGSEVTALAQWAMTGIPILYTCMASDCQINLQPFTNGEWTIHCYYYPPIEKGIIAAKDETNTSYLISSGAITYTGQATDTYTGVMPPSSVEATITSVQMEAGGFLVPHVRSSVGKACYVDITVGIRRK